MSELLPTLKELGWRRIVFSLVVLAYVGFLGVINALMFLPALGLLPDNILSAMGHFGSFLNTGETHDLIHEFVFAFIVGTAAVGLLSQLWKPKEHFAGQLVALTAWGVMILIALITNSWVPQPLFIIFGGLTLLATALHPARRDLFTWFSTARINRVLLALVIIAAVPLLLLAVKNINLQRAGINVNQNESGEFINLFGHKIPRHGSDEDTTPSTDIKTVKQRYSNYTVAQAEREGYILDSFCLDAASFGQSAERGAMGFHATNESLLRGPIAAERPQAFMFDTEGRVLGVEYEIMTDAVSEPPQLFGQTFAKLPPHPGVAHEHYALHVWFIDNPSGQFADFNPNVNCPSDSMPSSDQEHGHGASATGNEGGMATDDKAAHDQKHPALGHYRNLAALSLIIILIGTLASLWPPGWRFTAWIAGGLPILLGLASVVLPSAESSLGLAWGLATIVWGIVFVTTAEFIHRRDVHKLENV